MGLKSIVRNMKLRWRSKKTAQSVFSLTTSLRSPRRIIVLLPSDTGERAHAAHLLKELYELYTDSTFCLVGNTEFEQDSPLLTENSERLVPGVSELTWSGLPRGEFVEKVKTRRGDMRRIRGKGQNTSGRHAHRSGHRQKLFQRLYCRQYRGAGQNRQFRQLGTANIQS